MSYSPGVQHTQSERRDMVRRMSLDGMTIPEIAAMLRCDWRTVDRDRRALGLTRPRPRRFTEDEIERARQFARDGCPLREIAATLQRDPSTIAKYCRGMLHLKADPLRKHRKLMKQLDLL